MTDTISCLSIDSLMLFNSEEDMANRTLVDDPLKILIACSLCHESKAAVFQSEGDYHCFIAGRK
jgi:hypothetical protein